MAYKLFEDIWVTINNPQALRDKFVDALKPAYGVDYTIQKTVAKYVDPYNAAVVGLTTVNVINSTGYPEGEHFLIMAMRGLSGANATLAASAWVAGISDALTINGNFNVINSGSVELKNVPFTVFQPGSNYPDSGLFLLEKPIFWKAQTSLQMVASFPTAPSTTNQNIRVELMGIKLI